MTIALVPVKRLTSAKSRLMGPLDPDQREAFCLAMLGDVIAALRGAAAVDRIVVVTPDPGVGEAARAQGAVALVRDDPGLNAALDAGVVAVAPDPDEPVLVVLGDVAGALPQDVDALFEALASQAGGRGAVLAPSSDGGTAALLRCPASAIPARFGPDSAKRHREAAAEAGVAYVEVPLPSLAIDLDVPEDVERFLATSVGGERTRAALRRFGWGGHA